MDRRFARVQSLLRGLEGCGCGAVCPRISLEYGNWRRMASVWEESFPTRSAALRSAEGALEALYRQAEAQSGAYTDPRAPEGFLCGFQWELDRRLSALREAVGQCRTPDTAALANRLSRMLTPEEVFQEMERAGRELLSGCALPELSRYCGLVRCERHDPSECEEGLLWLLGKALIRWGYDLLPAIWQLEEDANRRLEEFRRAFDARAGLSISRHITAPVQARLPLLRELLERGAN